MRRLPYRVDVQLLRLEMRAHKTQAAKIVVMEYVWKPLVKCVCHPVVKVVVKLVALATKRHPATYATTKICQMSCISKTVYERVRV